MSSQVLPSVAVVILNYNTVSLLEKFLPSLLETSYENMEIIVADNGSNDASLDFVSTHYPSVRCIELGANLGFAGGYNKALSEIDATYYVLLNSDVEVTREWLSSMVALAMSNDKIAAIQPVIKKYGAENQYEYAGAAGGFIDRFGYPFCRGRIFDTVENCNPAYSNSREVFWASGACLLVKSSVFWEVGGLDARFFAHMEEIDLCWRVRNLGYQVWVDAKSEVFHMGGGTLAHVNPRKTYLNFHNGLAMLAKNLPKNELFFTILMRLVLDHIAAYRLLFNGKVRHFFAIAKAHRNFILGMKKWLQNPRPNKPLKTQGGIYMGSIVWAYFVQKRKNFSEVMKGL